MKLSEYLKNNDVELTEEQVSKLNEVLGVRKSKTWKPKEEELYYFIEYDGSIEDDYWCEDNESNEEIYSMGNIFKTKEEAEFELEKRKLIVELKRFADENNDEIDWTNGSQPKHHLMYDFSKKEIAFSTVYTCKFGINIYFSSKELAEKAIKKFGNRIKKYLFEVE